MVRDNIRFRGNAAFIFWAEEPSRNQHEISKDQRPACHLLLLGLLSGLEDGEDISYEYRPTFIGLRGGMSGDEPFMKNTVSSYVLQSRAETVRHSGTGRVINTFVEYGTVSRHSASDAHSRQVNVYSSV
jgi:hypothetical protein